MKHLTEDLHRAALSDITAEHMGPTVLDVGTVQSALFLGHTVTAEK